MVFDEAHKAKNFNSSKEELSTKVSQAVIKIQVMYIYRHAVIFRVCVFLILFAVLANTEACLLV